MIGQCLAKCNAYGIDQEEVRKQLDDKAAKISEETDMDEKEAEEAVKAGPGTDSESGDDRPKANAVGDRAKQ